MGKVPYGGKHRRLFKRARPGAELGAEPTGLRLDLRQPGLQHRVDQAIFKARGQVVMQQSQYFRIRCEVAVQAGHDRVWREAVSGAQIVEQPARGVVDRPRLCHGQRDFDRRRRRVPGSPHQSWSLT